MDYQLNLVLQLVSNSTGTVLGFSFSGATIPAGSGNLVDVYLEFTGDSATFSLIEPVFSSAAGVALEVTIGDDYVYGDDVVLDCEDESACNFYGRG